jgi:hypothetical protein
MASGRLTRSALIAGVSAGLCAMAPVFGAILSLMAGCAALALLSHLDGESPPAAPTQFRAFCTWVGCIALFVAFAILFAPMALLPAVTLAELFGAPLFGTIILSIESAVAGALRDRLTENGIEAEGVKRFW